MKYDPICNSCVNECKQPSSAQIVSCPHYKPASKNMDMFDMQGKPRKSINRKKKKTNENRDNRFPE
ncbi:MAG TPA: hypothetical protein PLN69_12250 [bacterium]|nr:hypothetical protein [bacterium]